MLAGVVSIEQQLAAGEAAWGGQQQRHQHHREGEEDWRFADPQGEEGEEEEEEEADSGISEGDRGSEYSPSDYSEEEGSEQRPWDGEGSDEEVRVGRVRPAAAAAGSRGPLVPHLRWRRPPRRPLRAPADC